MNKDKFADMVSILNCGLGTQNRLADLNKLVSERIGETDFGSVQNLFDELLAIVKETDDKNAAQTKSRLQELQSEFAHVRIEMLKEAKLQQALKLTNDIYVAKLEEEIREANEYLSELAKGKQQDARTRADVLKKRIQELHVTKTVGDSFSEQIKLTEDNLLAMSERIWNVLMQIMPLLRGRLIMESNSRVMAQTKKLIMDCAMDCAKGCAEHADRANALRTSP